MKIASNKYIQNFIKKTSDKKFYDSFNRNIPIVETAICGLCYCGAIYSNKKLNKDRKPALYYQTVLGCLCGMSVSKYIDNKIIKFKENVCLELKNKNNIKNIEKVINGFRIAIPLLTVATITRFAIPTMIVPISTKIAEIKNKNNNICI